MADASKLYLPGSGRQLDINILPASSCFLDAESELTKVCEVVNISYLHSGQTIIVSVTCKCSVSSITA